MKMNHLFMYGLLALGLQTQAAEKKLTKAEASRRIAEAVEIFSPLAESGVSEYKVKPMKSVRATLLEIALAENLVDDKANFDENWRGTSSDAWEGDSSYWGETTMKDAYSYVTEMDADRERMIEDEGTPADKAKYEAQIQDAKDAFKLLLKTGVRFGVTPMGAVQCGYTFPALAIIDPNTGKVWVFAKEGSGC